MQHIYPLNDIRRHQIEGADCWCQPRVEWSDPTTGERYPEALVIHNSADGREAVEQAEGYFAYLDAQEWKEAAATPAESSPPKLLPCPHCGAEASWCRFPQGSSWIECSHFCLDAHDAHDDAAAVAAWNRRTAPPPRASTSAAP